MSTELPHPDPDVLIAELAKLYDQAEIAAWLDTPQPFLGGRVPNEVIATPKGFDEVLSYVTAINDGAYL